MTPPPAITVLMPVRDGARWLEDAVHSILDQSFGDFEFLIIDDGSTDATPEILRRLAARDGRIRILGNPGAGLVDALNAGLAAARADLIARMDADDIAHRERFARQYRTLSDRPALAALGTFYDVIGAERTMAFPVEPDAIRRDLMERNCIAHPTVMFRREAVLAVGGYRAGFMPCEDYDLWLRLTDHYPIANLPEPLLRYRLHPGQVSRRDPRPRLLAEIAAILSARMRAAGQDDPGGVAGTTLDQGYGLSAGTVRRMVRDRAIMSARGLLSEGRRGEAWLHLAAAANGPMPPMTALRWARLVAMSTGLWPPRRPR
jgi:Glycosyl transferase family 2